MQYSFSAMTGKQGWILWFPKSSNMKYTDILFLVFCLQCVDLTRALTNSSEGQSNGNNGVTETDYKFTYKVESDLRSSMLNHYNRQIRPDPLVEVDVVFVLQSINYMNIKEQELSTTGYLIVRWTDGRFAWNNRYPYNKSINNLFVNEDVTWIPSIIIENSVQDVSVLSTPKTPMRINSDGNVVWSPAGIFVTNCMADVTYFPYDTQECTIVLSTRGYTTNDIMLKFNTHALVTTDYKKNGEWNFIENYQSTDHETKPEGVQYPRLVYTLKIRRRPFFQTMNIILPTVFLSFLSSMVFKLPAESGEKISYSLTVLLSYAVYLTIVTTYIPSVSLTISVLSVYLVIILFFGVVSVILTIIVLDCFHANPETEIPNWIILCVTALRSLRCCNKGSRTRVDGVEKISGSGVDLKAVSDGKEENKLTWQEVSVLLDALFIRLYLILITAISICVLAVLIYGYHNS